MSVESREGQGVTERKESDDLGCISARRKKDTKIRENPKCKMDATHPLRNQAGGKAGDVRSGVALLLLLMSCARAAWHDSSGRGGTRVRWRDEGACGWDETRLACVFCFLRLFLLPSTRNQSVHVRRRRSWR